MVKYTIPYRAHDDTPWLIQISLDSYTGSAIPVKALSEQACIISYDGETDDPFSTLIISTAAFKLYNEGQIDILELQKAEDRDFKVSVYRNGVLQWIGYLVGDGIVNNFKSLPYELEITATDGLAFLEDMTYVHADLQGVYTPPIIITIPSRSAINYFRQILFAPENLGLPLNLNWCASLRCLAQMDKDFFSEGLPWSAKGEGFTGADNTPNVKCFFIIDGMLRSIGARMFQSNGKWVIRRISDIVTGVFESREIAGDLGGMTVTTQNHNTLKNIGSVGYSFIQEDQVITVGKGVRAVKATYAATVRENVLPNGSMETLDDAGKPLYWLGSHQDINLQTIPGLSDNSINALKVTNFSTTTQHQIRLQSPNDQFLLPIDTKLYKRIRFNFTFIPVIGFPLDANGYIVWTSNPLRFTIYFFDGITYFYLNEFGFWQTGPASVSYKVDQLKLNDVAELGFDRFGGILMPDVKKLDSAQTGLYIEFNIKQGMQIIFDDIQIQVESNNEIAEAFLPTSKNTSEEKVEMSISTGLTGFLLSSYKTSWGDSDTERFFRDSSAGVNHDGSLTQLLAKSILRFKYVASLIYNGSMSVRGKLWSFDEIYTIDTLLGLKFLPLNATYNTETAEVLLIAMEARNDNIEIEELVYGANSQPLSN